MAIGLFGIRSSLADHYAIPSGSMEPTIQVGDHVWVDKRAYDLRVPFTSHSLLKTGEPQRGDVVVFEDPLDPSRNLIKRLVGVPGDRVAVTNGWITLNGKRVDAVPLFQSRFESRSQRRFGATENELYRETLGQRPHLVQRLPSRPNAGSWSGVVPEGKYFFLGDNRDNSHDSRAWGFATREALKGRAERVIYSVDWSGGIPLPSIRRAGARLDAG